MKIYIGDTWQALRFITNHRKSVELTDYDSKGYDILWRIQVRYENELMMKTGWI